MDRHVAMGLLFYPRGGSAQVARYLARALDRAGRPTELLAGSLGPAGAPTNAATFFAGLDVAAFAYDEAVTAAAAGADPIAHARPLHPSFEDRPGAPDRVFAAVEPELGERLIDAWTAFLERSLSGAPGVAHVHHLSPLLAAFDRALPDTPIVCHLHGTDLKLLDRIDRLTEIAAALGTDLAGMATAPRPPDGLGPAQRELAAATRWSQWRHGAHWAELLRAQARLADHFIAISPHDRDEAERLLGIGGDRITRIPNGVDTELFDRETLTPAERLARWREWLVADPQGWDESARPGSLRYGDAEIAPFADAPVLLFVGRFLDFKRVPLLIRAYARARERFRHPAPLVIWGGFPGEWEGEHPHTVATEVGAEGIFFAGWRGHDELARGLASADVMVAPSTNEPFGQVFLEAMATGLPVIATRSGGPLSFVNTDPRETNGWLVGPDDEHALAAALVEAVNDDSARRDRGAHAYDQIRSEYSWSALVPRFTAAYERAAAARRDG